MLAAQHICQSEKGYCLLDLWRGDFIDLVQRGSFAPSFIQRMARTTRTQSKIIFSVFTVTDGEVNGAQTNLA